jgi:hypothetical protein
MRHCALCLTLFFIALSASAQHRFVSQVASGPSFGSALTSDRWTETSSNATTVHTMSGACTTGQTMVVYVNISNSATSVSGATDSTGSNTWHIGAVNASVVMTLIYAYLNAAVPIGGTVTISYTGATFEYRDGAFFCITGAANSGQPDTTEQTASGYGTAISASATTTAANTLQFGVIWADSTGTYGSSAWTVSGAVQTVGGGQHLYYVYNQSSSAGSQNPGGTLSSAADWNVIWNAFK